MKLITLYLPEYYVKALDQLVEERFYPSRAEAIRASIKDLISSEIKFALARKAESNNEVNTH